MLIKKYRLENDLYGRIKKALKYGIKKTDEDRINFLNHLPTKLRITLSVLMHAELMENIAFFKVKWLGD